MSAEGSNAMGLLLLDIVGEVGESGLAFATLVRGLLRGRSAGARHHTNVVDIPSFTQVVVSNVLAGGLCYPSYHYGAVRDLFRLILPELTERVLHFKRTVPQDF